MTVEDVNRALRHLRSADPVMRSLIRKTGPYRLQMVRNRFQALVDSILAQQISGKAADSISRRLLEYVQPEGLTPERLVRMSKEEFRSLGISNQKAMYLLDLSIRIASRGLRLDRIGRLSDEQIIEQLTEVKGIGVWTAQMFLIFSLGRPDVFPHADLGVRMALRNLYGLDDLPNRELSHKIAAAWRPYASVATWYCWRSLDNR